MCHPAAWPVAMAIMSAATTAVTIRQQNKVADAQAEAAEKAAQLDNQQLADQAIEINEQAAQEKLQRQLQTARERGRIMAIQGEAGVQGISPLAVLNASLTQEAMDLDVIEGNRKSGVNQTRAQAESVRADAQGRVNTAYAGKVSGATGAMQIGSSAVSGYLQGSRFSSSVKKMGR